MSTTMWNKQYLYHFKSEFLAESATIPTATDNNAVGLNALGYLSLDVVWEMTCILRHKILTAYRRIALFDFCQ